MFHNTHSIFADIIWAEIFEPDLSNSIPTPLYIFAHFRALLTILTLQNLWSTFYVLSFDPASNYFVQ